ncbi:hypothetical protein [Parabacteroides chinchillae]|uniref:Uncharacterized protein n=1 Tax=Parabacteroides chinchillae TaxID=871327 RepID=A0A8G2F1M3_9BACT|nr:hypothetical protein [Parabacteroides chinchillae]SEF46307.1 hypothetical protein SAMN05444001_101291 [Parabacteroides chinchillae]
MIQDFVNKHFYNFFVASLIFCVLLYNVIGFKSADELLGLVLLVFYIFFVSRCKTWPFNKAFFITLGCFVFYTGYSFYIKSNTAAGIFTDLIIQMKPYLAFFAAYQMMPKFSEKQKELLKLFCLAVWILLVPIGIYSLVDPLIFKTIMEHPTNYAASAVCLSLVYLFCSKYTIKDKLVFVLMLSIGLFSGRSKFYGFFVLAACFVFYFNDVSKIKLNFKTITISVLILVGVCWVAKEKLELYFIQTLTGDEKDLLARFVLYSTSIDIFTDYFPFGSGLASFATHASGLYYSDIYTKYGIDGVWGLTQGGWYFVADTYYPSLAQFGIVGVCLFILFWIYLFRKTFSFLFKTTNIQYFVIFILSAGFLFIENVADASFTSNRGLFIMMFLGLLLSAQKTQCQELLAEQKEKV